MFSIKRTAVTGDPRFSLLPRQQPLRGRAHVESMFTAELPELKLQPTVAVFTRNNVTRVGAYVKLEFHVSGLGVEEASASRRLFSGSPRAAFAAGPR